MNNPLIKIEQNSKISLIGIGFEDENKRIFKIKEILNYWYTSITSQKVRCKNLNNLIN